MVGSTLRGSAGQHPRSLALLLHQWPSICPLLLWVLYADDLQTYSHCRVEDLSIAIARISEDAQAVILWGNRNRLDLHVGKCKAIIFGCEPFLARLDLNMLPKIVVNGSPLQYVKEVKNLRARLSSNLDFHAQVNAVVSKVFYSLSSMRFFRNSLSRQLRIQLIQSLVFPHLDYACATYLDVDKTRNRGLQTAQKACVRYIIGRVPLATHITPSRLELGWLCTRRRCEYLA